MIDYDDRTALVVVDMQNDFADPSGNLYVAGGEKVVDRVNAEIDRAVEAGALVVYTQDWHPETTPHFQKDGGIWPVHCVMGTWGADFHPNLRLVGPVVHKGSNGEDGYSGFTMRDPVTGEEKPTRLRGMLSERDIHRVVVVGLALDYCVKATALDAAGDYEVIVPTGATAAVEMEQGDAVRAIEELERDNVAIVP